MHQEHASIATADPTGKTLENTGCTPLWHLDITTTAGHNLTSRRTCSELTSSSCGSTGVKSASSVWVALQQHTTHITPLFSPTGRTCTPYVYMQTFPAGQYACIGVSQVVHTQHKGTAGSASPHMCCCMYKRTESHPDDIAITRTKTSPHSIVQSTRCRV